MWGSGSPRRFALDGAHTAYDDLPTSGEVPGRLRFPSIGVLRQMTALGARSAGVMLVPDKANVRATVNPALTCDRGARVRPCIVRAAVPVLARLALGGLAARARLCRAGWRGCRNVLPSRGLLAGLAAAARREEAVPCVPRVAAAYSPARGLCGRMAGRIVGELQHRKRRRYGGLCSDCRAISRVRPTYPSVR